MRLYKTKFVETTVAEATKIINKSKDRIVISDPDYSQIRLVKLDNSNSLAHTMNLAHGTMTSYLNGKPSKRVLIRKMSSSDIRGGCRFHSTIGSDPEFFVEDANTGEIIPAFEIFPAKSVIHEVYWDGYQAEFAPNAASCLDGHRSNINLCLTNGRGRMAEFERKSGRTVRASVRNTVEIPEVRLLTDHPKFVNFGCKPSFNVYDEPSPLEGVDPRSINIRSAGGHIHITLPSDRRSSNDIEKVVKALDAILGVCAVAMFQKYDDARRRLYYGRAGEFRITSYGIEYRVLSNAWLIHPVFYNLTFELMRRAVADALDFGLSKMAEPWQYDEDEVRRCINECDVELAKSIIKKNRTWFRQRWHNTFSTTKMMQDIMGGLHKKLQNPDIFHGMIDSRTITVAGAYGANAPKYWD